MRNPANRRDLLMALAGALVAATGLATGVGRAEAQSLAGRTITVGTSVAPFGFADPVTAQPTGYSVEVMKAIAADAGLNIQFKLFTSFGELIPALQNKAIDVDASSTSITSQRIDMGLAFTGIYARWHDSLVVPASDTRDYTTVKDLADRLVGATTGTTYLNYLKGLQETEKPFAEVVDVLAAYPGMTDVQAGVRALQEGKVNGWLVASFLLPNSQAQGQYRDVRTVASYIPVLQSGGGIAVRADDTELLGALQASLSKLIANGTVGKLAEKWGLATP